MQQDYAGLLRKTIPITGDKMEVIYGLIPSMIFIGIVLVVILFWAIKTGQFDDFEGEAHRILMDDDLPEKKNIHPEEQNNKQTKSESTKEETPK